jgi:hypothetical protein
MLFDFPLMLATSVIALWAGFWVTIGGILALRLFRKVFLSVWKP